MAKKKKKKVAKKATKKKGTVKKKTSKRATGKSKSVKKAKATARSTSKKTVRKAKAKTKSAPKPKGSGRSGTVAEFAAARAAESGAMPVVGDLAPKFKLEASNGETISLDDFRGEKNVVLYFYPKDDTPGCTKQACDFRDSQMKFDRTDTVVIGVSTDDLNSHGRFINKYNLTFNLMSDPDHKTADKYGTWVEKNMYGRKYMGMQRSTFLIDKEGRIRGAWPRVSVDGHSDEVLHAIERLD